VRVELDFSHLACKFSTRGRFEDAKFGEAALPKRGAGIRCWPKNFGAKHTRIEVDLQDVGDWHAGRAQLPAPLTVFSVGIPVESCARERQHDPARDCVT